MFQAVYDIRDEHLNHLGYLMTNAPSDTVENTWKSETESDVEFRLADLIEILENDGFEAERIWIESVEASKPLN